MEARVKECKACYPGSLYTSISLLWRVGLWRVRREHPSYTFSPSTVAIGIGRPVTLHESNRSLYVGLVRYSVGG